MCVFDWLNENEGAMTAILSLVTVITTIAMAYFMVKANRLTQLSIQQSRDLEKDRVRPHLIFDFSFEKQFIFAELRNEGLTSARNVSLVITPEISTKGRQGINLSLIKNKISFFAPGKQLRDYIGIGHTFFEQHPSANFKCNIQYQDLQGTEYLEEFDIDISYYKEMISIGTKDIGKELEHIRREIKSLNNVIDRGLSKFQVD